MSLGQAAVLGVVQGLGEFLPISSSGHLIVVPWLLGWVDHSLAFDVALHLGTLLAVLLAFAGDWRRLIGAGLRDLGRGRPFASSDARLLWLLAAASVPGAAAGLLLESWAETAFRTPGLVAATMAGMGGVLLAADRGGAKAGEAEGMPLAHAHAIGLAQALAIVPGVSRSGATISAALFLGYRREASARFSFLLATPITAGAALVKVPELLRGGAEPGPVLIGVAAAALVGLLSIRVLLAYVRTRDYTPFVAYRFGFAALVVAVLLVRSAHLG
jgi:undecaprenyl-diphosphatase